jgi:hypothetical protein
LMLKHFGVSCLVLHILLNQMAAFIWGQCNKEQYNKLLISCVFVGSFYKFITMYMVLRTKMSMNYLIYRC